jgi:murein DD-endopeptidase MepM/ murein hydrolase activator NlpD
MVKQRITSILMAVIALIAFSSPASALTSEDKKSVLYSSEFYSAIDTDVCGATTTTTNLSGNDNIEKGYNYFAQKGLSPVQSAALIGNFMQESGMDPRADQPGGPGMGIAQWSEGGRWDVLLQYAAQQGVSQFNLGLQLDFVWKELNGPYQSVLTKLKSTTDLVKAVTLIASDYEIAGDVQLQNRIGYAQEILKKYGGNAANDPAQASATCGGAGGGVGTSGDFTFPERTTQAAIKNHNPTWCFDSQTSCHHDYVAADIFNNVGTTNIVAVKGVVLKAVDTSCHGGFDVPRVQIRGSDGKYYYYTHMKPGSIRVHDGQSVAAGTALGVIGPSECAENTSPHLHFQMSSVVINNTADIVEQQNYINPQPNLVAAFAKLPEN